MFINANKNLNCIFVINRSKITLLIFCLETFPHAGQNLGSAWSTSVDYFQASDPLLADIIRRWYDEVADCDLSLLQSYENIEDGYDILFLKIN